MAALEAPRIGYYENGVDYGVALHQIHDLDKGSTTGGFLADFKRVVGVGDDFGGEHRRHLNIKHGRTDIEFDYASKVGGRVSSILFRHNVIEGVVNLRPDHALDFIEEVGQPLRAERHDFREVIRREGTPYRLDEYDYSVAREILQKAVAEVVELAPLVTAVELNRTFS